jgi:hypothetical protein
MTFCATGNTAKLLLAGPQNYTIQQFRTKGSLEFAFCDCSAKWHSVFFFVKNMGNKMLE